MQLLVLLPTVAAALEYQKDVMTAEFAHLLQFWVLRPAHLSNWWKEWRHRPTREPWRRAADGVVAELVLGVGRGSIPLLIDDCIPSSPGTWPVLSVVWLSSSESSIS
jgi:hypothetical protein